MTKLEALIKEVLELSEKATPGEWFNSNFSILKYTTEGQIEI